MIGWIELQRNWMIEGAITIDLKQGDLVLYAFHRLLNLIVHPNCIKSTHHTWRNVKDSVVYTLHIAYAEVWVLNCTLNSH
jgi:hypothetical protein